MISMIAAVSMNGAIGNKGKIPWKIKKDFAFFKTTTLNSCVVMGRSTFESMGSKPLKDRLNVVVSSTLAPGEGFVVVRSIEEALGVARAADKDVFLIGGSRIYQEGLSLADRVILTDVKLTVDGDAFFPYMSPLCWSLISTTDIEYEGDVGFCFTQYRRVK